VFRALASGSAHKLARRRKIRAPKLRTSEQQHVGRHSRRRRAARETRAISAPTRKQGISGLHPRAGGLTRGRPPAAAPRLTPAPRRCHQPCSNRMARGSAAVASRQSRNLVRRRTGGAQDSAVFSRSRPRQRAPAFSLPATTRSDREPAQPSPFRRSDLLHASLRTNFTARKAADRRRRVGNRSRFDCHCRKRPAHGPARAPAAEGPTERR